MEKAATRYGGRCRKPTEDKTVDVKVSFYEELESP
jgi:hypothetical protein